MNRAQLLAAEIFGYSFANYADHLGIGNVRYERLMPEDAETLEAADLAFLLEQAGKTLSQYSRHLRREPGVEYYEGYFDA